MSSLGINASLVWKLAATLSNLLI
jgi:chromate reductase